MILKCFNDTERFNDAECFDDSWNIESFATECSLLFLVLCEISKRQHPLN